MASSTLIKGDYPWGEGMVVPDRITWAPKNRELSHICSRRGDQRDSKHEKGSAPPCWLWDGGGQPEEEHRATADKEMATSVLQPQKLDSPTTWISWEMDYFPGPPQYSLTRPKSSFQPWETLTRDPSCVYVVYWPSQLRDNKRVLFEAVKIVVICHTATENEYRQSEECLDIEKGYLF